MKYLSVLSPLICSFLLLVTSCNKNETEDFDLDMAYDYFPLEIGQVSYYEVDTIFFNPYTASDSTHTFVKEEIVETLLDNNGEVVYRVERFERKNPEDPWKIHSVVILSRNDRQAFRTEDNLRFTKLVFPPTPGKNWDGNTAFDPTLLVFSQGETIEMFKSWDYSISDLDQPATIGELSFDQTLTLTMAENENLIELREAKEQYARGIGLIYREMRIFDTQCTICCNGDFASCENIPWTEKAEKGFILRQWLTGE